MRPKLKMYLIWTFSVLLAAACASKLTEKPFISPPYPKLDQAFTDFTFDAATGDTLLFAAGSRIIVPANIWVDSAGNKISGNINIRYREFSDAGDIFLAGVPLAYDTAGKKESLVTAGMFEIRAFKENSEIYLDKDKSLKVQMASNGFDTIN